MTSDNDNNKDSKSNSSIGNYTTTKVVSRSLT